MDQQNPREGGSDDKSDFGIDHDELTSQVQVNIVKVQVTSSLADFLAGLQSHSGLWIDAARTSVCQHFG